jgi:hypothetical protein
MNTSPIQARIPISTAARAVPREDQYMSLKKVMPLRTISKIPSRAPA